MPRSSATAAARASDQGQRHPDEDEVRRVARRLQEGRVGQRPGVVVEADDVDRERGPQVLRLGVGEAHEERLEHRPDREDEEEQAERQREDPRGPPLPPAAGRPAAGGGAGPPGRARSPRRAASRSVAVDMVSLAGPDGLGLLLHGLQRGGRVVRRSW